MLYTINLLLHAIKNYIIWQLIWSFPDVAGYITSKTGHAAFATKPCYGIEETAEKSRIRLCNLIKDPAR